MRHTMTSNSCHHLNPASSSSQPLVPQGAAESFLGPFLKTLSEKEASALSEIATCVQQGFGAPGTSSIPSKRKGLS